MGTENSPDQNSRHVGQHIFIVGRLQGGEETLLEQESFQFPLKLAVVLQIGPMEAVRCRVQMLLRGVYRACKIRDGFGLRQILDIKKRVLADGNPGRKADGVPVDKAPAVGLCAGGAQVGAAPGEGGPQGQKALEERDHILPAQRPGGRSRLPGMWEPVASWPPVGSGEIEEQKGALLLGRDEAQKITGYEVVRVHKDNPLPPAGVDAPVPGGGYPLVVLEDAADSAVPPAAGPADLRTAVRGGRSRCTG